MPTFIKRINWKSTFYTFSLPVLLFVLVFLVYIGKRAYQDSDSRWNTYTAMSIIKEGNTDLDDYENIISETDYFGTIRIDDKLYNYFPIGPPLVALPFVYVIDTFSDTYYNSYFTSRDASMKTGLAIASFIVAVTSVFVYFIGRQFLNKSYSLLLALIFSFCTSAWSTASRALWQHGPSMLMLAIALYMVLRAREKPKIIQFLSLPLAFSYVIRPLNSISIAFFTLFVLLYYRKYFLRYVCWSLPVAVPFIIVNYTVYGSLLPSYYEANRLFTNPDFFEALIANLISPGRGIFIFSPVLFMAVLGFVLKAKDKKLVKLDYFLAAILVVNLIALSSFLNWWGGWSFGNRYITDMLPFLMYFMIPVLEKIPDLRVGKKAVVVPVLTILIIFSFFINYRGATAMAPFMVWHTKMITSRPSEKIDDLEVWHWHKLQFLEGFPIDIF